MRIYYFDDSGDRAQKSDNSPWFVLGGFGIDAAEVPMMNAHVVNKSRQFGLELEYPKELKFYHIGKAGHGKAPHKRNWMVDAGIENPRKRRALGFSVLRFALCQPSVRAFSVAIDRRLLAEGESPVLPAIRLLLDRAQMDLQDFKTDGLVFMDEENALDKELRAALRSGSGLIKKYTRILDTIAFMPSEESPGIQVADLVAGGIGRFLNTGDPGFARVIWPRLRHREGVIAGYGIKLAPGKPWLDAPAPQTVPWPEYDRDVHEFEFLARGDVVQWDAAGNPSWVWSEERVPGC